MYIYIYICIYIYIYIYAARILSGGFGLTRELKLFFSLGPGAPWALERTLAHRVMGRGD